MILVGFSIVMGGIATYIAASDTTKYFLYALEFIFISLVVQVAVAGAEAMPITSLYSTGINFESAGLISGSLAMMFISTIGATASMILAILGIFVSVNTAGYAVGVPLVNCIFDILHVNNPKSLIGA